MDYLSFGIGMFWGVFVGVMVMCLIQINRGEK